MGLMQKASLYMRERQPLAVRLLHITVIVLVLSQILFSNFMEISDSGKIGTEGFEFYGTWAHLITGLVILPIALAFVGVELKRHGFTYFFPYLSGKHSQLKDDIQQLKSLKIPEPNPYGIAAIVKGLGIGALALVVLSGGFWFLSWGYAAPWADSVKEVHEAFTGLIEAYVIGHGGMGVLHIILHAKNTDNVSTE